MHLAVAIYTKLATMCLFSTVLSCSRNICSLIVMYSDLMCCISCCPATKSVMHNVLCQTDLWSFTFHYYYVRLQASIDWQNINFTTCVMPDRSMKLNIWIMPSDIQASIDYSMSYVIGKVQHRAKRWVIHFCITWSSYFTLCLNVSYSHMTHLLS
jgi:hypothetical protein